MIDVIEFRRLKRTIIDDPRIASLSDANWRVFVSYVLHADDSGMVINSPLPVSDDVDSSFEDLIDLGLFELCKGGSNRRPPVCVLNLDDYREVAQ